MGPGTVGSRSHDGVKGHLLPAPAEQLIHPTDGRYIEAAREQVSGAEICLTTPEKGHLVFGADDLRSRKNTS